MSEEACPHEWVPVLHALRSRMFRACKLCGRVEQCRPDGRAWQAVSDRKAIELARQEMGLPPAEGTER
jgi:hypothetical protein